MAKETKHKPKAEKPVATRVHEVAALYQQLEALGLPRDLPGIQQFRHIASAFVRDGISASGSLPLEGTKRTLVYKLSMLPHVTSTITLRFTPHV